MSCRPGGKRIKHAGQSGRSGVRLTAGPNLVRADTLLLPSAPRKLQKNIVAAYTAETYSCNTCQCDSPTRWPSLVICLGDLTKRKLFVQQDNNELHWVARDATHTPGVVDGVVV